MRLKISKMTIFSIFSIALFCSAILFGVYSAKNANVTSNGLIEYKYDFTKDYQQVEYIKTTGTQYINMGIKPTNNTKVYIDFMYTSVSGFLYGSRQSVSSTDMHACIYETGHIIYPQFGSSQGKISDVINILNVRSTLYNSQDGAVLNSSTIKTYNTMSFTSNYNMYLGALNQAGSVESRTFKGQIYACKVWEGSNIVRDFVPCYRISDNVIGLYDLVSETFYVNAGTGTFAKGADVK